VVALQITEQPHRIAAETRLVTQARLTHVLREVDRRQTLDVEDRVLEDQHGRVASRAAELVELSATTLEIVCEARRGRREERLSGRSELAVLDQRLDDGKLEQRQVCRHRGEGAAAELATHAVAVRIRGIVALVE